MVAFKETYAQNRTSPCKPENAHPLGRLQKAGSRYYSPVMGRWVSRDPIEEEGGLNVYSFPFNNTICFSDPFGLKCCTLTWPAGTGNGVAPHVALQCDNGTYVSWYPSGNPVSSPGIPKTPAQDVSHHGGVQGKKTCNDCFDEKKVATIAAILMGQGQLYKAASRNCADIAMLSMIGGLPANKQVKPTCPKRTCLQVLLGCHYLHEDLLDTTGLTLPSAAENAMSALKANGCNRYRCKLVCPSLLMP
jgi:RHS repeat-associated protein